MEECNGHCCPSPLKRKVMHQKRKAARITRKCASIFKEPTESVRDISTRDCSREQCVKTMRAWKLDTLRAYDL